MRSWKHVLGIAGIALGLGMAGAGLAPGVAGCLQRQTPINITMFHGDRARLGWNAAETELSPVHVSGPAFGPIWSSPPVDSVTLDGRTYPPRLYATPLYVDGLALTRGPHAGAHLGIVFAASSNGRVYAISASASRCAGGRVAPGTILWRTRLAEPAIAPGLDGGVLIGVLSTPIIDLTTRPARLYVTAMDVHGGWRAFALDLATGDVLRGWPVAINEATLAPVNRNGPARFAAAAEVSQRAALALSPRGDVLYLGFGSYRGGGPGWLVAVNTRRPGLLSAFAGAPTMTATSNAGIWGAGGPAVDREGRVYMTTGNSPADSGPAPGVWGNSLLQWSPSLALLGAYTPFNACVLDRYNMDLGASSPVILPDLADSRTTTPRLLAFGGKQGTVYLVSRSGLAGGVDRRPACQAEAREDRSLLPPEAQPQFGMRGPLHVFGPYTERHGQLDHARMRTTPAYFRDPSGTSYLFVTGASKATADSAISVAPGLVRLRVVTPTGAPAYLAVDGREMRTTLVNPGSPVVTSNGGRDAIVWVLDPSQPRTAPLVGPEGSVARPVLHAFDAFTLERLWRSAPGDLEVGGKYSSPTVGRGMVIVGTDRIQAFGLRASR
jgi:outer membrane protein assembly factor BamB